MARRFTVARLDAKSLGNAIEVAIVETHPEAVTAAILEVAIRPEIDTDVATHPEIAGARGLVTNEVLLLTGTPSVSIAMVLGTGLVTVVRNATRENATIVLNLDISPGIAQNCRRAAAGAEAAVGLEGKNTLAVVAERSEADHGAARRTANPSPSQRARNDRSAKPAKRTAARKWTRRRRNLPKTANPKASRRRCERLDHCCVNNGSSR